MKSLIVLLVVSIASADPAGWRWLNPVPHGNSFNSVHYFSASAAVAVLLTLLALDVKNIRIGPSLPAFLTPNLVKILVDKFGIMPVKTADEDLKAILG